MKKIIDKFKFGSKLDRKGTGFRHKSQQRFEQSQSDDDSSLVQESREKYYQNISASQNINKLNSQPNAPKNI